MQIDQQLVDIQNVVDDVLKLALKKGATQAEASMSKVQGIAVSSRMQEVENVEFTNDGGLGISVYVGKCKGSASTADLSKEALTLAVEKAVDIARYTSEDPCTGLADAELIATEFPDLDLYHPQVLDTEKAIKTAIETEAAAMSYDNRITNSDGASYNANLGMRVYGNTHGINAGYPSSRYSLSCMVIGAEEELSTVFLFYFSTHRNFKFKISRRASRAQNSQLLTAVLEFLAIFIFSSESTFFFFSDFFKKKPNVIDPGFSGSPNENSRYVTRNKNTASISK